jgi:phage-related minor tail protein
MPGPSNAGEVYIDVLPWMRDFEQKLKAGTESTIKRISGGLQRTGKSLTKFVTLPILAGGAAMVKLASDANETENKIKVIFGKMAGSVIKWSKTSIEKMGLARATAQDMAAELAAIFQAGGFGAKQVAGLSESFTQLAADMASFFNVPAGDALNALRSGLVGEAEPLRRFGVLLTEARVKQEAVALGLAKAGAELTEQQKVQARASIIQKSLTKATGDYARTADGVANKSRAAGEQVKELGASFGKLLLPFVQKLLSIGVGVLKWFDGMDEGGRKTVLTVLGIVAVVGPLLLIFGKMIMMVKGAVDAFKLLNTTLKANPYLLIIAATIAIAILIIANWSKIKNFVIGVWNAIKARALAIWNGIKDFFARWWPLLLGIFTGGLGLIVAMIIRHWGAIRSTTVAIWNGIKTAVLTPFNAVKSFISRTLDTIKSIWSRVWGTVETVASRTWTNITNSARSAMNAIVGFVNRIIDGLNRLVNGLDVALGPFINLPSVPHIPGLQHGGRIRRAGFYEVGERGPEIRYFDRGGGVLPNSMLERVVEPAAAAAAPSRGLTVENFNVQAVAQDPAAIAREFDWMARTTGRWSVG